MLETRRTRAAPRRRRRRALLWAAALLLLGAVFFAGLAIGRALEQGPRPGGTETRVRTLEPQTLPPAERTVTVTTTAP